MTTPDFSPVRASRRSSGVGLVTAIFLLVVLAALGVAMVGIFTTQQAGAALDEQGARAYQAARAGIEWGLYRQLRQGACNNASFGFPANSSLSGFTVTVTCTPAPAAAPTRWLITSTACNLQPPGSSCPPNASNSPDYVQRRLEAQL